MISVKNACDMHIHTSPDIFPRVADDVEMATICHLSAEEGLKLIHAARDAGCEKVLLTHPFFAPPECSVAQIKEAVDAGAYVEFCAGNALSQIPHVIPLELYKETVDACGSDHFIISSDCGHPRKTLPPETIRMFGASLTFKGVREADVENMMVHNYEKLLPLDDE